MYASWFLTFGFRLFVPHISSPLHHTIYFSRTGSTTHRGFQNRGLRPFLPVASGFGPQLFCVSDPVFLVYPAARFLFRYSVIAMVSGRGPWMRALVFSPEPDDVVNTEEISCSKDLLQLFALYVWTPVTIRLHS